MSSQLEQATPHSRRRSGEESDESQEAQLASHVAASTSEPSNPVFLMNSDQSTASSAEAPQASTPPPEPKEELPLCWICQQDASEDTPETSIWRRPCPCSLTAHDDCLIEWITSQEAPKPGEMATTPKIVCPVCQAPIRIARPRDFIVTIADFIQKTAKTVMIPTAVSAVFCTVYSGLYVYGWNAMHIFFGYEEAARILMPTAQELRARAMIEASGFWRTLFRSINLTDPFLPVPPGLRLFLGLPMIAPALVLSRTKLADQIFAILPITYFVLHPTRRLDLTAWPPSPALTLAVIPYIRTTYNELYKYTFAEYEKQWDKAVLRKPRAGETVEQIAAEQGGQGEPGFFNVELEVRQEVIHHGAPGNAHGAAAAEAQAVEEPNPGAGLEREAGLLGEQEPIPLEIDNEEIEELLGRLEDNQAPHVDVIRDHMNQLRELRNAVNATQAEVQRAQAAAQVELERARALVGQHVPNDRREIRQNISITQTTNMVMGALFFPAISSVMGSLLGVALPASWVTGKASRWGFKVSNGLLTEKWGRSIVGGCLFVILKDAVTLYCKWKKARDFGKKKVLDYVGGKQAAA